MSDSTPPRPPKQPSGVKLVATSYPAEVKAAAREAYVLALAHGNGHKARRLARKACNIPIPLRTVARWCEAWEDDEDVKAAADKGRARILDSLESMSTDAAESMHKIAVSPRHKPTDRALAARVVIGAWGTKLRDGQVADAVARAPVSIEIVYPSDDTAAADIDPKEPK